MVEVPPSWDMYNYWEEEYFYIIDDRWPAIVALTNHEARNIRIGSLKHQNQDCKFLGSGDSTDVDPRLSPTHSHSLTRLSWYMGDYQHPPCSHKEESSLRTAGKACQVSTPTRSCGVTLLVWNGCAADRRDREGRVLDLQPWVFITVTYSSSSQVWPQMELSINKPLCLALSTTTRTLRVLVLPLGPS